MLKALLSMFLAPKYPKRRFQHPGMIKIESFSRQPKRLCVLEFRSFFGAFRCGFIVVVFAKRLAARATATFFCNFRLFFRRRHFFLGVLFARVRRKCLKSSIKTQNFDSRNICFISLLRFYSGSKKHYKTQVKFSELLL